MVGAKDLAPQLEGFAFQQFCFLEMAGAAGGPGQISERGGHAWIIGFQKFATYLQSCPLRRLGLVPPALVAQNNPKIPERLSDRQTLAGEESRPDRERLAAERL